MVLNRTRADRPTALWVVPVADLGGVARHAADVASTGLPGWDLRFLVPDGPVVDVLRDRDADVVVAPFGPAHGWRSSIRSLRAAAADVDLVHSHLAYADVVAALATPRGVPLVSSEHGLADDDLVYHGSTTRSRLRALAHRARLRRTDALILVSEATSRVARTKWHLRPPLVQRVIHNGIDQHEPTLPAPGLHVVSLARLAPEKRLEELVRAFAVLAHERSDARLTLAGVGPLEGPLRELAHALGLADRIALPGYHLC